MRRWHTIGRMLIGGLDLGDLFMLVVRWMHVSGALAWVGGSVFFTLVIRPANAANPEAMRSAMGVVSAVYREVVDLSIIAIVLSGVILAIERLTDQSVTLAYVLVLGLKISLAVWMIYLVWRLRRSGYRPQSGGGWQQRLSWVLGYNAIAAFGVIVFFLSSLLQKLFEAGLR